MRARPELEFQLTLPPADVGLLLAALLAMDDHARDKLEDPSDMELAKAETDMVRRVRRQVEKAVGAAAAAQLEEEAQERYSESLRAMGFGGEDEPPVRR